MKKLLFPSLLVCLLIACNSNNSSSAKISENTDSTISVANTPPQTERKTTEFFILDGHEILMEKKTDLNNDGFEDVVLILKNSQEETISDYANNKPSLRPLLFLAGDEQGSLRLVARNDKAVYCIDCGGQMGDPLSAITIDKGFVSIEHYGGGQNRWSRIVTFKYDNNKNSWFLHKDGTEAFEATNAQESTETTKQGDLITFENFDIYKQ